MKFKNPHENHSISSTGWQKTDRLSLFPFKQLDFLNGLQHNNV